MARSIIGVIVGYLAMAVLIFATFSLAYLSMGADRAFQAGSYDPSPLWLILSFVLAIAAAVVGGAVCRLIAPTMTAVYVLAGIALVLGLAVAIPAISADRSEIGPRTGDVSNMDAMNRASTPAWVAVVNPLLGAAGILVGGLLIDRRRSRSGFEVVQD